MWQEIAIIIIDIATVLYIGFKLYKTFMHPPKSSDPCCGCSGCALKEIKKDVNRRKC